MASATVLLIMLDEDARRLVGKALQAAGFEAKVPAEVGEDGLPRFSESVEADAILVDEKALALPALGAWLDGVPYLPVLLFAAQASRETLLRAVQVGAIDIITPPVRYEDLVQAIQRALTRQEAVRRWVREQTRRHTRELQGHIDELQTLLEVGRILASELDPDKVLTAVVNAAVDFTDAEESTLFLLDEHTGELYLRASRDLRSGAANTLRLKVNDSLAGQVVRSGQPVILDSDSPEKIKTAYLVHALIYVPLLLHGRVIGVLGVDNREKRGGFTERHVARLNALADYAAIALDNAQLFTATIHERRKLETVLRHVKEGVLVLDESGEVVLINDLARLVMDIPGDTQIIGRTFIDLCRNAEVEKGIQQALGGKEYRTEITAPDGRVFSLQAIPIPGVGAAVTFHDVTHFKELDRIKSEFVSAVSHDLRSPLTAILGYVELLERAGPLTPMQQHFVARVRTSVQNITALINDLLDLGRIEAGFEVEKEVLSIATVVRYAVDGLLPQAEAKHQHLVARVAEALPPVLGNAVRLRQMLDNIIGNAIKYTPEGGLIEVEVESRGNQVILRVRDNGPGIPPSEQPYIFNKFFRGSNVASEQPGTGLGLAIVKSIVESHHGRVWVKSEVGKGTEFTVVLPGMENGGGAAEDGL